MKGAGVFFSNSPLRSGEFLLNLVMAFISLVGALLVFYIYWDRLAYGKTGLFLCAIGWYVMVLAILRAYSLHGRIWEKLQSEPITETMPNSALSTALSVAERSIKDGLYFTAMMLSLFILVTILATVRLGRIHWELAVTGEITAGGTVDWNFGNSGTDSGRTGRFPETRGRKLGDGNSGTDGTFSQFRVQRLNLGFCRRFSAPLASPEKISPTLRVTHPPLRYRVLLRSHRGVA